MKILRHCLVLALLLPQMIEAQQFTVTSSVPVQQLVQNDLLGQGVQVSNITFQGHPRQFGRFTNTTQNLQLGSGIFMCTGYTDEFVTAINTNMGFSSENPNAPADSCRIGGICEEGDDYLDFLLGDTISHDAAVIEFDFVPEFDSIRFRYVFASEEYNDFVCSNFNDLFAFIISGPGLSNTNIAKIPGSSLPVAINSINNGLVGIGGAVENCSPPVGSLNFTNLFVDNHNGVGIEFDGMTVALTAVAALQPCATYHIKLVVADVSDAIYDSGVFLEAGSFSSTTLNAFVTVNKDTVLAEGCNDGTVSFQLDRDFPTDYIVPISISGTATQNIDYTGVPDTLVIPAGSQSASFTVTALADSIAEGLEIIILRFPLSACSPEYDSIIIKINEEIVLPAPDSLFCASFLNTQINFGWTAVPEALGYEVSTNAGSTWQPAAPGPLQHNANRASPNEPIMLYVRAIGGTPGCSDNGIDSILCFTCGIAITVDSVAHLPCDGSPQGMVAISVSGGFEPYSLTWSNGSTAEDISGLAAGTYTVTVVDALDCHAYAGASLQAATVPEPPIAYVFEQGQTQYSIALGDAVELGVANNQSGNNISYYWVVSGGDTTTAGLTQNAGTPIVVQPTENGVYSYRVICVANNFGAVCLDSAEVQLIVTGYLGIPDAFTPNGDNLNDRFRPVHLSAAEVLEFKIYDRWGQLMYNDPDISDGGWDGNYRNQPQPRDAFLYVLRFKEAGSDEEITVRGEFMLIR